VTWKWKFCNQDPKDQIRLKILVKSMLVADMKGSYLYFQMRKEGRGRVPTLLGYVTALQLPWAPLSSAGHILHLVYLLDPELFASL